MRSNSSSESCSTGRVLTCTSCFSRQPARAFIQKIAAATLFSTVAIWNQRPAHALDRLLRAVHRVGVLPAAGDLPERGLLAVARPVSLPTHRVTARLMLPVVVTA